MSDFFLLSNLFVIQPVFICQFSLPPFLLKRLPHHSTTNSTVIKPIRQACRVAMTKVIVLVASHSASQAVLAIEPIEQVCRIGVAFLAFFGPFLQNNVYSHFNLLSLMLRKGGLVTRGDRKTGFFGPFCKKNSKNNVQYFTLMKDYWPFLSGIHKDSHIQFPISRSTSLFFSENGNNHSNKSVLYV
jgi:hypothetical protein